MTWVGHLVVAVGIWQVVKGKPVLSGLIFFGAVFPDWVERLGGRMRILPHRTVTHSLALWSVLTACAFLFQDMLPGKSLPLDVISGLKWFLAGVWSHLATDAMTITGIPLFFRKPRIALKLFATGSWKEYLLVALFTGVCFLISG